MVEINATLIVQAFNFFLAYLILRYLLCKPTVRVIEQEERETESLQAVAQERTRELEVTVEAKEAAWKDFKGVFAQQSPQVTRAQFKQSAVEPVKQAQLSQQQLEQLTHDLQQAITKKVQHVE